MLKRTDEADGDERNVELLGEPKGAQLEFVDAAIASALAFWKDDEAHAAVDGVFCETPQALQVTRATDVWNRDVSKALHQQTVNWNPEMRFQLPAARELRNCAIQGERIKQVHVI